MMRLQSPTPYASLHPPYAGPPSPGPLCPPLQFEKQFENLDVQSEFVEQAMQNQAVLSTPEEDVNMLVQQARTWLREGAGVPRQAARSLACCCPLAMVLRAASACLHHAPAMHLNLLNLIA